jgi:hypothetical protein
MWLSLASLLISLYSMGPDAFVSAEMRGIWQERDKTNANAWDNMWPT